MARLAEAPTMAMAHHLEPAAVMAHQAVEATVHLEAEEATDPRPVVVTEAL